jgi:IS30 family transposase
MSAESKRRGRWSAKELSDLQDMLARQVDRREIARQLNRTVGAVEQQMYKLRTGDKPPSNVPAKRSQRRRSGAFFFLS